MKNKILLITLLISISISSFYFLGDDNESEILKTSDENYTIDEEYNELTTKIYNSLTKPTKNLAHLHTLSEINIKPFDYDNFLILHKHYNFDEDSVVLIPSENTYIRQVNGNNEVLNEFLVEMDYTNTTFYNNGLFYFLDIEKSTIEVYDSNLKELYYLNTTINLTDYHIQEIFFSDDNVYGKAIDLNKNNPCLLSFTENEVIDIDIESDTILSYPIYIDDKIYYYEYPNINIKNVESNSLTSIEAIYKDENSTTHLSLPLINYENNVITLLNTNTIVYIDNYEFKTFDTIPINKENTTPLSFSLIDDENFLISYENYISKELFLIKYNIKNNTVMYIDYDYTKNNNYYTYMYSDDSYTYMYGTDINTFKITDIIVVNKDTYELIYTFPFSNEYFYTQPTIINLN